MNISTPHLIICSFNFNRFCCQEFQDDVEAHKEIVDRLDRTGTYLKYYGAKHDAIVIRNQLLSIKLRWKRLLWKTEERGRLLTGAYKEDKRVSCGSSYLINEKLSRKKHFVIWDQKKRSIYKIST